MIRLLSDNLYSDDSVFLRELLQNGADAISARKLVDETFTGEQITVTYAQEPEKNQAVITVSDNGIGLTQGEIHEFLSIIGRSSKRMTAERDSYIGQFGIGLLSCFLVAETIEVVTRSAREETAHLWRGKSDGTYDIAEAQKPTAGTDIMLTLRGEMYDQYDGDEVAAGFERYGYCLKTPILYRDAQGERLLNNNFIPWREEAYTTSQVLEFGETVFGQSFLDAIPLSGDELEGYAFISNRQIGSAANNTHKIYLKDMFITQSGAELIPKWAFFVKCVVNAKHLTPTASRESFQRDSKLLRAKAQIERCILQYFSELALYDQKRLTAITQIHNVAIKSLAVENDQVYGMFFPFLSFPTSRGPMTGGQLLAIAKKHTIFYCTGVDAFRKFCPILEQKTLLVNGGYIYDSQLLGRISKFHKNLSVKLLQEDAIGNLLNEIPDEEAEALAFFIHHANAALRKFNCACEGKIFAPPELPSLFVLNDEAFLQNEVSDASDEDSFSFFEEEFDDYFEINLSKLYLNCSNTLVQKFAAVRDIEMIETIAEVLYVQALMMGHHPVGSTEMKVLSKNLTKLLELGLG